VQNVFALLNANIAQLFSVTNHDTIRPTIMRVYTARLPQVVSQMGSPCRRGPLARCGNQKRSMGLTNEERKKLKSERVSDFM